MSSMLNDAVEWLGDVFSENASEAVLYSSGSQVIPVAHATQTGAKYATVDSNGVITSFEQTDFLIPMSELVADSEQVYPSKGDTITLDDGRSYEVLNMPGVKPWEYLGGRRHTFRVHTKQVIAKAV